MRVETPTQSPTIDVELGGLASADSADRVRTRILSLDRYAPRPIIGATVRFSTPSGRARTLVVAHATLALSGTQLVAFGTGVTVGEATDRVRATLRRQLLDMAHGRRRHGRAGSSTSDDKPVVVRHASRMPTCASPEQAVLALDQLDQEFGLYVDATTGREAVVWRTSGGEYAFATERPAALTESEALQRLLLTGDAWLFYTDLHTGHGHIAHRRGDHRYGVITPVATTGRRSS